MKTRRFFNCIIFIVTFILVFATGCFYENIVSWNKVYESFQSLKATECYASENSEVIIAYLSESGPIGRLNKDNEYIFLTFALILVMIRLNFSLKTIVMKIILILNVFL